jgi:2-oxoisovalerate dehydrogenase E1 component
MELQEEIHVDVKNDLISVELVNDSSGQPLIISKEEILNDYGLAFLSRQLSVSGKKDVHNGRAKFGIFGDGKEVAQIAYAKCFMPGDWRSGYYRDQTFMLAAGLLTPEEFFAQLYGETNPELNPSTGGRNFNNHFATRNIDEEGNWLKLSALKNSSSDISPTSGQMPRLLGLAYASKLFRSSEQLWHYAGLSDKGNEVAFGTIGEASTSEGLFFETINAASVMQVPMAVAVWDDGYGISVPVEMQTVKASISQALSGFKKENEQNGCLIYTCKGWDYVQLVKTFREGIMKCRNEHVPVIFHIREMTQPLGHSSSGSHERYKSDERLNWENEFDPIRKMREWIIDYKISDSKEIEMIELEAINKVREARQIAWNKYLSTYLILKSELIGLVQSFSENEIASIILLPEYIAIKDTTSLSRKDILKCSKSIRNELKHTHTDAGNLEKISDFIKALQHESETIYSSNVTVGNKFALTNDVPVHPTFGLNPKQVTGREILNRNFDYLFQKFPLLVTFGEDTGKIGDVNHGLHDCQEKYGELRISDTSIREATIIGQGIGLALRGFRPVAEIQYLDYLIFALQTISDDLATIHYRSNGGQVAPVIIRTRGHRLVGMWHSGSPLGMIINSVRGIHVCVPRNMTQAAGFYNTLIEQYNPAIVIEPLKGYDLYEDLPDNIGEFKIPLGIPDFITRGTDVTLVTYGWCVHIARKAIKKLESFGISVELIDVQTLLPFDSGHMILESIKKTNAVLFLDEDVPGGATAFMMQKVLEEQKAYNYLDAIPRTLSAKEHRPAYDTDGDYFSKPNIDNIVETVYGIMHEKDPERFPTD